MLKQRKAYKRIVHPSTIDNLIVSELYEDIELYPGSLLDNYIFTGTDNTKMNGIQPRQYIIVTEVYESSQSSQSLMIWTNKKDTVEEYRKRFEKNIQD